MVPPGKIGLEDGTARLLPVLVMTCAHSRFTLARMIPPRTTEEPLLGMWDLLSRLGAGARRVILDNETGIVAANAPAEGVSAFAGTLATRVVLLPRGTRSPRGWWSARPLTEILVDFITEYRGRFGVELGRIAATAVWVVVSEQGAASPLPHTTLRQSGATGVACDA